MHLLDTGIVLELRAARTGRAEDGLMRWAGSVSRHSLFLSALTLLELEQGATRLEEKRDKPGAAALREWIDGQVLAAFDGRMLAVDAAVARRAARLGYADTRDALMAATALEHGLTLVTRDLAAFRAGKVKLFDPAGYSGEAESLDDWREASRGSAPWLRNLFIRT